MILNRHGHTREICNFFVRKRKAHAVGFVNVDGLHTSARTRIVAVDHLYCLAAEIFAQNRELAGFERHFVNVELVRIDSALYDRLTEPPGRVDKDHTTKSRFRIEREHDAR